MTDVGVAEIGLLPVISLTIFSFPSSSKLQTSRNQTGRKRTPDGVPSARVSQKAVNIGRLADAPRAPLAPRRRERKGVPATEGD